MSCVGVHCPRGLGPGRAVMVGATVTDPASRINRIPMHGGIVTKLAALACVFLIACGGKSAPKDTTTKTTTKTTASDSKSAKADKPAAKGPNELYDRLGGQRAIVAVIDDFIGNVAADKRIRLRFLNTDIPKLKLLLVEFVCYATGGPCKYTGQDMETSHA